MYADTPANLASDSATLAASQLVGKPLTITVLNQSAFQREVRGALPDVVDPDDIVGLAYIGGSQIFLPDSVYAALYATAPSDVGYAANILAHEAAHTIGITDERQAELRARSTEHRLLRLMGLRGWRLHVAESYADWQSEHSPNLVQTSRSYSNRLGIWS